MRYLLVDRVTTWTHGKSITGIKNVAMAEDFLEFHFPKSPVMPGVLLLEAMAQLAGWLMAASSDFSEWFLLENVDKCKFYGFALPGDQVEMEVTKHDATTPAGFSGIGTVNGKKKVVAEFSGIITSLDELEESEEQRRFFKILTRDLQL